MNDVSTPGKTPAADLRGIDPQLFDERGNHATALVRAPCDAVAAVLSKRPSLKPSVADLLVGPAPIEPRQFGDALILYQLRGHPWTQIEGRDYHLLGLAEELSRELRAPALHYMFQDVSGGRLYSLYDKGERIEELSDVDISWLGPEGAEECRQDAVSRGCRLSAAGSISFFSKRGTLLDLESPQVFSEQLDRVAKELGLFVAADVFTTSKSGHLECLRRWSLADVQAAAVLMAISEQQRRRESENDPREHEQLVLTEDSQDFQRLQQILRGELPAELPPELDALFKSWSDKPS